MESLKLKDDFYWVGVLDDNLKVFDIIMYTEFGTTYNSYLLKASDKVVLFETVKEKYFDLYIEKLKELVDINSIDYLVVSHTEPDHSGSIEKLIEINPNIKIIASSVSITFLREIVNKEFNYIAIKDKEQLIIGNKTLTFFFVPNLHWPDTIYTYIEEEKVLVTCDSFGSHYSFKDVLQSKVIHYDDYMKATKYYFDNIIGPFSSFMLTAIEKIKNLQLDLICPGHGPVIDKDIKQFVEMYKIWSTHINPNGQKTVVIPYVSSYGYTEKLAFAIKEGILKSGDIEVKLFDMVTQNQAVVLKEIFNADGLIFGTPTILQEALKPIWDLLTSIYPVTHQKKLASSFGSFGWSGEGVDNVTQRLKQLKMNVMEGFKVRFNPNTQNLMDAFNFGVKFGNTLLGKKEEKKENNKRYKCLVCGEEFDTSIDICPICGVGKEQFVIIDQIEDVKVNKAMSVIIIGGGIAGLQTAIEIRNRNDLANLYIISNEKYLPYNRTLLTKELMTDFEKIEIKEQKFYQQNNIHILLDKEVIEIDKQNKEITLNDFTSIVYDSLVFATGSRNNILNSGEFNKNKIISIRSLEDVKNLKSTLKSSQKVVIVGAGVLGLELASELVKFNMEVSLIEKKNYIMENDMDAESSKILKKLLENNHVKYYENNFIRKYNEETVELNSGELLEIDLLVFSIGTTPNIELAKKSGIETNKGIVVNENLRTSVQDIYAVGDVAEFQGRVVGLWNNAIDMAKSVGKTILTENLKFERDIYPIVFKIFDYNFQCIGKITTDYFVVANEETNVFKKYYFEKEKLVGAILINSVPSMIEVFESVKKNVLKKEMLKKI